MEAGEVKGKVDFGILTIREDEFTAVLKELPDKVGTVAGQRSYRIRRLALSNGEAYTVAVLRCAGQGNTNALNAARDLLEDLEPAWLLIVGIAGGVPADEFTLGDVVVSTEIADFSVEAVLQDHAREYALAGGPLHRDAAKLAADLPGMVQDGELDGWNEAIGIKRPSVKITADKLYGDDSCKREVRAKLERHFAGKTPRPPAVVTGAIASSDRLIKDAEILAIWRKITRQIHAVEMESAGVYKAAHGRVPFLSIRGISDIVGYKRHPDWTAYACYTAAAFTHALLLARPIPPRQAARAEPRSDTVVQAIILSSRMHAGLHAERLAVNLRRMGLAVLVFGPGAEHPNRTDESCTSSINASDIVILLVSDGQEGSPSGSGETFLEFGYREAKRLNKPILAYKHAPRDTGDSVKLAPPIWQEELRNDGIRDWFGSPEDLTLRATADVGRWVILRDPWWKKPLTAAVVVAVVLPARMKLVFAAVSTLPSTTKVVAFAATLLIAVGTISAAFGIIMIPDCGHSEPRREQLASGYTEFDAGHASDSAGGEPPSLSNIILKSGSSSSPDALAVTLCIKDQDQCEDKYGSLNDLIEAVCSIKAKIRIDIADIPARKIVLSQPILIPSTCKGSITILGGEKAFTFDASRLAGSPCAIDVRSDGHQIQHINITGAKGTAFCIHGNKNNLAMVGAGYVAMTDLVEGNHVGIHISGNSNAVYKSVINGSVSAGVIIEGHENDLSQNYIGTTEANENALPKSTKYANHGDGVRINGSRNIIGSSPTLKNWIAFNEWNGITVVSGAWNNLNFNTIYRNGRLGIDLGNDGVTVGGTCNSNANHCLAPPLDIGSIPLEINGKVVPFNWIVFGRAPAKSEVHAYLTFSGDHDSHGQGKTWLGTGTVNDETVNGFAVFSFGIDGRLLKVGTRVTLLAIRRDRDSNGRDIGDDTSEFSNTISLADSIEHK